MRIIGGMRRGKKYSLPKKYDFIRPTADRVREAVFNIIGARIAGADFLDLFCGSGMIGMEAISRGARMVDFVDSASTELVERSCRQTGFHNFRIERSDVFDYLRSCRSSFSIVYADPPYTFSEMEKLIETVIETTLLGEDGLFFLETGKSSQTVPRFSSRFADRRCYGDTIISIFYRNNHE